MSAFICDGAHITALAAASVELGLCADVVQRVERETNNFGIPVLLEASRRVGEMLHRENVASYDRRYLDDGSFPFEFRRKTAESLICPHQNRQRGSKLPAVRLLRAIDCYQYQASEHAGWRDSEAFRLTEELREAVCRLVPGYSDAAWGWDE